jgi:asparagine synthase (glutamine-hydrolysing)
VAAGFDVDVRGYSAVFPGNPDIDEWEYVDAVSSHAGIRSRGFAIEPRGSLAVSLEYVAEWEAPVMGAGYLLERPLAEEAARDGMEVVLDGQGGDEVFGGTPYLAADHLRRGRLLRSIRTSQSTPWTSEIPTARARFGFWRVVALNPWIPDALFASVRRMRGREVAPPPWLSPASQLALNESVDDREWKHSGDGPIWWRYMVDLLIDSAGGPRSDYLRHRAAHFGLEARPPLLDVDLARLALRLPPELALDPARDRPLIRDATRGVLAEKVRTRSGKSNLSAFYREIATKGDLDDFRRLLSAPDCAIYDYVERDVIKAVLERPPQGERISDQVLVDALHSCAMIECWLRRQEDPSSTERLQEQVGSIDYREPAAA